MNDAIRPLALIPARGGSKGIPRKNLREVGGLPLLAHTVRAACRSRQVARVLLSTDDPEIAAVGALHGAAAPFLRPAELARDSSPVFDAALHALEWLERHEQYRPEWLVLLQPTSPFRSGEDIDAAIGLAAARGASAVVSVCEARRHPCLAKRLAADGSLAPFADSPHAARRRQDLPPAYDLNGALYLVRRETLLAARTWCPPGALAYVMPPERSLDIDSPWDLAVADTLMRAMAGAPGRSDAA